MELAIGLITSIIGGVIVAVGTALLRAWSQRQEAVKARPKATNLTAYEMAYRGMLHELAGRRIKSKRQMRDGKAWLREATYTHKQSSIAGWNDAIDDMKEAVITSTNAVTPIIRCDANFLERQIRAKLQSRMGNRPVDQIQLTLNDAVRSAELYQQIIQSQMRMQEMISTVARFTSAVALFAAAMFLLINAPGVWGALDSLTPYFLAHEWLLPLKITYCMATVGFLGGGFGVMFSGR